MKTIEFTDEERTAVIQLLDLAVQNPAGGGLKVAGAVNYLASKFADPAPQAAEAGEDLPEVELSEE
jgi:hypothetical protein